MGKQEIKITENLWPVIIKESDEGNVEAICPFFSDCQVTGNDEGQAMLDIESQITRRIKETTKGN